MVSPPKRDQIFVSPIWKFSRIERWYPWVCLCLNVLAFLWTDLFEIVSINLLAIMIFTWLRNGHQSSFDQYSLWIVRLLRFQLPICMMAFYFGLLIVSIFEYHRVPDIFNNVQVQIMDLKTNNWTQSLEAANEIMPAYYADSQFDTFQTQQYAFNMLQNFYKVKIDKKEANLRFGQQEVVPTTWPGYFWPIEKDAFNYRYRKDIQRYPTDISSPIEKYAKEFGYSSSKLMDKVSARTGLDHHLTNKRNVVCYDHSDCQFYDTPTVCSKRKGRNWGVCAQRWCGYCTEWSAATILFPHEPARAVTGKRATFSVLDQKALLTLILTRSSLRTVTIGGRCTQADPSKNLDQYGRMKSAECRDLNPGIFHILLMNIVGKKKRPFGKLSCII